MSDAPKIAPAEPPFCPHVSTAQILAMQSTGMAVPVGKTRVQGDPSGLDLKGLGKTGMILGDEVPVYQVQLGMGYKTPAGVKPDDKNPRFVAEGVRIPCQGAACVFWSAGHAACKYTVQAMQVEEQTVLLRQLVQLMGKALAVEAPPGSTNQQPAQPAEEGIS